MGRAGSIVEVSDGHAINFIIPRMMGVPATATNLKQAEFKQKQADTQKALDTALIAEDYRKSC